MVEETFEHQGERIPASPVVLSVPHAGRNYPPAICAALRVPLAAVRCLEDRYVDLVATAARGDRSMLVQTCPRAWIDLNRGEDERDPKVDRGACAVGIQSAKVRSGLGLVPRRALGTAELWSRPFSGAEIDRRIATAHRPYHEKLATLLAQARTRFGVAVLIDVHSMPPLVGTAGASKLVIGDRFGRSAAGRIISRIEEAARDAGVGSTLNIPYAGGHLLERHGMPSIGIHAVQLELDRSLYLDGQLAEPGAGLAATACLLRRIVDAVENEALTLAAARTQAAE